ncbi:TIGR03943 family putative permease subunit [Bacillus sp. FJAT-45350]|uniref:TIGR03943 family putative permease subunit n=1 Tax=Bacillus sp. FJAT-45350 TaxID=2011014 RepID=UPI000BB8482A|nr:TIGR03943 family protein [Bacillus sp. FJAT-45350]
MNNNNQDLGFHAYIRGIILIGFALLLVAFIVTGNIRFYIAPKMMPFIYFATGTFIVLGVIQIIRSTKKGQEEEMDCDCGADHSMGGSRITKLIIYSIFVIPIVMGFVLPDRVLDSSVAANRGIQYGGGLLTKPVAPASGEGSTSRAEAFLEDPDAYFDGLEGDDVENHFSVEDFYTEEGFNTYYKELAEELSNVDRLIIDDENYLDIMTMLDIHLEEFIGREIEMLGFVYREPEFEDNQLVVARFAMTCCVADASVYGTMIETEDANMFENDTWIRVSGTLDQTEYNEFAIPLIHLREFEMIDEPEQPYVFPSFR